LASSAEGVSRRGRGDTHNLVNTGRGMREVRLEAVSKRYREGRRVLVDVDMEIPSGEVVAVAGSNGSGKSTLLRILVGLSRPTSGTVSGRPDVLGYVPDRFPPNERLSAAAYLRHMGRIRGLSGRQAETRSAELLDRLALVGGSRTPIRALSKGNAQKVALAQALLVPPELLVLDEPWSGLDASAHGVLAELIGELAKDGGAVVFTDHRESVAQVTVSRVYEIHSGRLTRRAEAWNAVRTEVSTVLLRPPSDGPRPGELDWRTMNGVVQVTRQEEQVTVRVATSRCDAVLLAALQHGWSVGGVQHPKHRAVDLAHPGGVR
jgi:ABC-type multidrug transport system ATPase subunit